MSINPAFLKIGGGLVAAGGATTIGIVYKGKFFEWINGNDDYVFIVSSSTGDVNPSSSKKLYEENKKNYKCKYGEDFYECDIVVELKANDKKILKVDDLSKTSIDKTLEVSKLKHSGNSKNTFLLKVKNDSKKAITIDATKNFEIVQADDTSKLFGKLTPVLGKQNGNAIGKFQFFLAQVKSFSNSNGNTFAITSGDNQKCYFDSNKKDSTKKSCEIHKLGSAGDPKTKFDELTFDGKTPATKISSGTIKLSEYYIIKISETTDNKIDAGEFNGKNLIFLENGTTSAPAPQKTINFQPINGIDLIEIGNDANKNHLIIF